MAYNEKSIKVLPGLDHVRKRPAMYIGNTSESGYHHLVWEIVDNGVDEAVAGFCKNIEVLFGSDGSVTVSDDGRGIPVKKHPTQHIPTVDVVLTMLHAGGKFGGKDSQYRTSGGLHGVGAAVVNALSTEMEVWVSRGGKVHYRKYNQAVPTRKALQIVGTCPKKKNGTKIRFLPDPSHFRRCQFDKSVVERRLRELSFLNAGVKFKMVWKDGSEEVFHSEKGLTEYVGYLTGNKKLLHDPMRLFGQDIDGCEIDIAFAYDDGYDAQVHSFANNIATHEGGVHYNAVLNSFSKVVEDFAGKPLSKLGLKVNKSDVVEGLTLIVSVRVPNPEFGGQTKTKLNNDELRLAFGNWMRDSLTKLFRKHKEIATQVVDKVIDSIKARDAARKAKAIQRKKSVIEVNALTGKLKDCSSKNPELSELFIVEGDSAGGGAENARNREFQAVLPLRGKVLNVAGKTLNQSLTNNEIASLISALGVVVTAREVMIDDLRYHKVIIMADADPDGAHISCLLITLFHKFMRKIIEEGYLYVCELPLYRVRWGSKSRYLKDDQTLADFKQDHPKVKLEISRFKGLGEMDVDELEETAMSPTTRILRRIHIEDNIEAQATIDCLMGSDVASRKTFLAESLEFDNKI